MRFIALCLENPMDDDIVKTAEDKCYIQKPNL
jgi:hypothetical protein